MAYKQLQLKAIKLILAEGENEFTVSKYPGRGAYLLEDGRIAVVYHSGGFPCVNVVPTEGFLITEPAELVQGEALQAPGAMVDPHRLIDQFTEFAKVMKAA